LDLAQPCELRIQGAQSVLQHLAVAGILSFLHLLENMASGQQECFLVLLPGGLLRCKSLLQLLRSGSGCLLVLDRLAFPAASHV